jgi:flagellum-specific ATP synthase
MQQRELLDPWPRLGMVERITGLVVEGRGPQAPIGSSCQIEDPDGGRRGAEIIGFRGGRTLLMPLSDPTGIGPGARIRPLGRELPVPVGPMLRGRVLNALGEPIDGLGPLATSSTARLNNPAPAPLERPRITEQLGTGIRSIDTLLSCGRGQRLGIFAGAGVGKSVLLGMIARGSTSSVNVIGLIGERGREVREFIERDLGEAGLARSVVVAVTGDQSPLMKRRGAQLATALAESFRDSGEDVLLLMDSLTRVAQAQREIVLAAGEPPASKGYPPSVYTLLPALLERSGNSPLGSITAFYTVLVEGDDLSDPVSDAARSVLDGHIVLSRRLADRGHYPAVDVLASVSRARTDLLEKRRLEQGRKLVRWLAAMDEAEDLIQVGAYAKGSNQDVDEGLKRRARIEGFLKQDMDELPGLGECWAGLEKVVA